MIQGGSITHTGHGGRQQARRCDKPGKSIAAGQPQHESSPPEQYSANPKTWQNGGQRGSLSSKSACLNPGRRVDGEQISSRQVNGQGKQNTSDCGQRCLDGR